MLSGLFNVGKLVKGPNCPALLPGRYSSHACSVIHVYTVYDPRPLLALSHHVWAELDVICSFIGTIFVC